MSCENEKEEILERGKPDKIQLNWKLNHEGKTEFKKKRIIIIVNLYTIIHNKKILKKNCNWNYILIYNRAPSSFNKYTKPKLKFTNEKYSTSQKKQLKKALLHSQKEKKEKKINDTFKTPR